MRASAKGSLGEVCGCESSGAKLGAGNLISVSILRADRSLDDRRAIKRCDLRRRVVDPLGVRLLARNEPSRVRVRLQSSRAPGS